MIEALVGECGRAMLRTRDFAVEGARIGRAMLGLVEEVAILGGRREAAAPNCLALVPLEGVSVFDNVDRDLRRRLNRRRRRWRGAESIQQSDASPYPASPPTTPLRWLKSQGPRPATCNDFRHEQINAWKVSDDRDNRTASLGAC